MSGAVQKLTARLREVAWCDLGLLAVLLVVTLYAYWTTGSELAATWSNVSDYSHGILVAPLAGVILWNRRDSWPGVSRAGLGFGLVLLAAAGAMRYAGARWFLSSLDGWSIPVWLLGAVCVLAGFRAARWCLPGIAFLLFMVPLPWRVENALSGPLQSVATRGSCWLLQCLGQPALVEGNVIILDQYELEVVRACSGLRMLYGILALTVVYVLLKRKAWFETGALLLLVVPIAVMANILRITATGLLYRYAPENWGARFSHDLAGWFTIALAAVLMQGVMWYVSNLFVEGHYPQLSPPRRLKSSARTSAT